MRVNWNFANVSAIFFDPFPLKLVKPCKCGAQHQATTPGAVIDPEGHLYFQCDCQSTMVIAEALSA